MCDDDSDSVREGEGDNNIESKIGMKVAKMLLIGGNGDRALFRGEVVSMDVDNAGNDL